MIYHHYLLKWSPIGCRPIMLNHVPVLQVLHVIVIVLVEDSVLALLLLRLVHHLFRQNRLGQHHLANCVISGQGVLGKEAKMTADFNVHMNTLALIRVSI